MSNIVYMNNENNTYAVHPAPRYKIKKPELQEKGKGLSVKDLNDFTIILS